MRLCALAMTRCSLALALVMYLWQVGDAGSSDNDAALGNVVRELRAELQALQRGRDQDRAALRRLEERLAATTPWTTSTAPATTARPPRHRRPRRQHEEQRAFARSLRVLEQERQSLDQLENQLKRVRDDLQEVARERPADAQALLRADLDRLQLQLDALRSGQRDEVSRTEARDRAHRASVDWLRSTVDQIKAELAELSRQDNVTVALGLSRGFEGEAARLRADLADLRDQLQAFRATQQRCEAGAAQAAGERAELRALFQRQAVQQRQLTQQVSELAEDFRNQRLGGTRKRNNDDEEKHQQADALEYFEGSGMEPAGEPAPHPTDADTEAPRHEVRHHRDLRQLVYHLQRNVQTLSHDQSKLTKDISRIRRNSTELSLAIASLQGVSSTAYSTQLDSQLRQLEDRMLAQSENVRNVSSCFQSVDKVHASTVELFRDLRSLEKKVDRGLTDLRKEVSKCDFDVATALSLAKAVRQDELARRESLASLKNDLLQARSELDKTRYKILSVEGAVLNTTVSSRRAGSDWVSQEIKIANLEVASTRLSKMVEHNSRKLAHLARSLDQAVNREVLDEWKRKQEDLSSILRNMTEEVPKMRKNITRLEGEVEKFEDNLPQDCSSNISHPTNGQHSGVQLIHPHGAKKARLVFCDMQTDGGGWTVVQRRCDGSQDFYRNWDDYKQGFGDVSGEHWLGNDALHEITSSGNYSLRIDLWDVSGNYKFVEYDHVVVGSEAQRYRLEVLGYRGNASNALEYHSGMAFSTADRDNDFSSTHCAVYYSSGWWYNHCQYVNINGKYKVGLTWYDMDALEWVQLSRVEMKLRPATRRKKRRWTKAKAA
ncbi:uncharacterized protein [Dermacentor andersoni]|uniref:uncharacterized protein n=1 Tax=Dermacentor andersoni TaxID=34620 RepID=UPI0021559874|nr:protein scabrous-like [Dermacentor andersoni]